MWLGNVFMGTIGKILPYINGFVMALKELIKMFAVFVGYKAETPKLEEPFGKIEGSVGGISSGLGSANKQAKELKRTLQGFDVLNVITTPKEPKGGSGSGGGGIGTVDPKILGALKEYDSIMEKVQMKATKIRDKIMDWLGFTKQINPFTGEISWKLKEGFTWIKAIGGVIAGLTGLFLIAKLIKLVGWLKNLIGVFKGTVQPVTSFQNGISLLGQKLFITTEGVGKHATAVKKLNPIFLKLAVAVGGLISAFKGISNTFDMFDRVSKGVAVSNKEITKSVLEVVGGFSALGAAIGGPLGAVIGAFVGILAELTATIVATNKAFKELAKKELYGDLTISVEDFTSALAQSDTFLKKYAKSTEEYKSKMQDLSGNIVETSNSIELSLIKSGDALNKLGSTDIESFKSKIQNLGNDSVQIIDESTNRALMIYGETFKGADGIIDEGEQSILNKMMNYAENQKSTIQEAQNNMTNTYSNAVKTRGYLTEQEKKYIEEQMKIIEDTIKSTMSTSETDMQYISNNAMEFSKETYENFKKASEEYKKTSAETSSKIYNDAVNTAKRLYDSGAISQDDYNKMVKEAGEERERQTNESNSKVEEYTRDLLRKMADKYSELEGKTDKTSKNMRKEIENTFKDYNIDASDIVSYSSSEMQQKGRKMGEEVQNGFKGINWGKFHLGIDPSTGKFGMKWFANGGLPDVGEMFIAREAGPELVGKIGNSNAVMNNNQIVEAVSQGVAQAVSAVMGGQRQGNGNVQVFIGDEQITDIITRRKSINDNVMGY